MDKWLQWVMVGAWLYCVLRLEKVAYDLKKAELIGLQGPPGVQGPAGVCRCPMPEDLERPEVDRPGIERLGFTPDNEESQ